MHGVARLLRERKDARRTTGARDGQAHLSREAEVDKCAGTCDYYAEHAERFLSIQPRETDAVKSHVRFDPSASSSP
jgi:succinate-semialdehyde dehydrogenase/glutarate-semialdehyde dehydrogenase